MSLKIGVILGSTRPNRVGRKVADWFMKQVKDAPDFEFTLLDLAEINLPFLNEPKSPSQGDYQQEHTKKWSATIDALDGFVFVTAEYNHGIPAPLKNALDTVYHEWNRKPAAFVGYGGLGGARAIEQLVEVTARVGMAPLSIGTMNIMNVWAAFDDNGVPKPDHVDGNFTKFIDNLHWWTQALKTAREADHTTS
jgi:NAD(P)H-dependent FMN reductase